MFDEVTIEFHYGGYFTDPPNGVYVWGVVHEVREFDIDKASFFEFRDYMIELGYLGNNSMYFKVPGLDFDDGLRRIESDMDAFIILEHYKNSKVLTIYIERGHEPLMVVSPKGKILMQNIHTESPLKQLLAAEVASGNRKLHREENYAAGVEDETSGDEASNDDPNVHQHPHDPNVHQHSDESSDDDGQNRTSASHDDSEVEMIICSQLQ